MLSLDHVEAPVIAGLHLPKNSTCVVAGAYKGDTVAFIREHFPDCLVYGYEPQKWAYDILVTRFEHDILVALHPYALGTLNMNGVPLYEYETDACSLMPRADSRKNGACNMIEASRTLPPQIDLFVMNLEGYEEILLPYLLLNISDAINIDRVLVQEHGRDMYASLHSIMIANDYKERVVGAGWFLYVK